MRLQNSIIGFCNLWGHYLYLESSEKLVENRVNGCIQQTRSCID